MPPVIKREGVWIGAALIAAAALLAFEAAEIPSEAAYARVGPSTIPWIVLALLGVLGLTILSSGVAGRWPKAEAAADFRLPSLGWLIAGLAINVIAIGYLGFILASTLLFVFAARAFGSRRMLRNAALGFAIASACYVTFDRLLGYQIGGGPIEALL